MTGPKGTFEKPENPVRRAMFGAAFAASTAAALAPSPSTAQGRRIAAERSPLAASSEERRILAESIGAKQVVELGTSTGYSGLWLLLALAKTGGRLTTFEIDRGRHQLARENFERAGVLKLVTPVLGNAHAEVTRLKESIDLLFLDADKEGYLDYLQKLGPLVRAGGLIVAHNMASPPPDPRYVEAVTTNPAYETVFLNMHEAGVGVTLKKR